MGAAWIVLIILTGAAWIVGWEFLLSSRLTDPEKGFANRGKKSFFTRGKAVLISVAISISMWIVLGVVQGLLGENGMTWAAAIVLGVTAGTVVLLIIEAIRLAAKHWIWALVILSAFVALVLVSYHKIPGLEEFISTLH